MLDFVAEFQQGCSEVLHTIKLCQIELS